MLLNPGVRVAGLCCREVGGEFPFEFLRCGGSAKHLVKVMPPQEQGLVAGDAAQALRHPEINILCPWLVLNSLQRPEILGYGMVFQAVKIFVSEYDF